MRWILKIILFPVILLLSILISILKFLLVVGISILSILSFITALSSFAALFYNDLKLFFIVLVMAFIISPFGLPYLAMWIVAHIEVLRDKLKEI